MGKAAVSIVLTQVERREWESLARARKTGQAMARRARIVLAAAAGLENKMICVEVGAEANTVSKWRRRFAAHRLDGLLDEPRPGTPRQIGDDAMGLSGIPCVSGHDGKEGAPPARSSSSTTRSRLPTWWPISTTSSSPLLIPMPR